MSHREDVIIKTHYKNKELCIENLIDHKKKTFFSIFLKQLSGVMTDDGNFEISSRYHSGAMFEFKGCVVEEIDGVYLKGCIKNKSGMKRFVLILSFLLILAIPVYISAWGLYGVMFMSFIVIDVLVLWWYLKYGDALYKDVMRKIESTNDKHL